MRRTTISRSRASARVFGLALCLVAAPLAAQQPAPAQQPAQPQQPATELRATAPATHVVVRGETLWGLAQQFLGDPLLWPEIYRINTSVVEDPHWIYPGEELRLVPGADTGLAGQAAAITVAPAPADTAAAAQPQPAPPGMFSGPTVFNERRRRVESAATLQLRDEAAYRAVRQGEHFSAGFLTDGEDLRSGELLGTLAGASIERLELSSSPQLFTAVGIAPPSGDSVAPGRLYLVYELSRGVPGHGNIVHPTGLVKVTEAGQSGGDAQAQVIAIYDPMKSGQRLIPVAPFQSRRGVRPVATDSGLVGRVIAIRDPHELLTMQDVVFIDQGAEEGVKPGDIFEVSDSASAPGGLRVRQDEGRLVIVHTRPHSSTGVVVQLSRPDIRVGALARQVRRMPS